MSAASGNPYAAMADMGLKMISGISNGVIQDAQINAQNIINEANAWANNLVRGANNNLKAARGSLARYTQSVNNQRTLDNAGSSAEAATVNYRRARDSAMKDDFETQIRNAEQAGGQAAAAALSGLTGGVADLVTQTSALRRARVAQRFDESTKQTDFDAGLRQKQIMQSGWDSLDSSTIAEEIDYNTDIAAKQTRGGNIWTDAYLGQDMKNVANVSAWGYNKAKDWFDSDAGISSAGSAGKRLTNDYEY